MPGIVISEFQAAGPGGSADDFIEITNTSGAAIDISGWTLVYRSAHGTIDITIWTFPAGTIMPAGGHLLGVGSSYSGSVSGDFTSLVSISGTGGGLGLYDDGGLMVDAVGWGDAVNIYVEGTATGAPGWFESRERLSAGSQDTNDNSADFALRTTPDPQNAASPAQVFNDAPTGGVTITGALAEDETLTADTSTLADADGLGTLHYQWQRDTGSGWVDVGTDQATYVLGDADVHAQIRVVVSYTDGGSTAEQVTSTAAGPVTGVDDAAVPADDAVVVAEDSTIIGDVFADNGSGVDSDAEDDALVVTAVNGSTADVGTQITLPSGALLTLNADGTFAYDPGVAFIHLPGPVSGAVATATDSFTYTLAGGGTATVTVTINGVDGDGDILIGTAGDDALAGGDGADTLVGSAGNDSLAGGDGSDLVDYRLAASGVTVGLNNGTATNDGDGGTDTLTGIEDVFGSAFNDLLIGAADDNYLRGGQGADILIGLDGDDTLEGGGGAANQMQGGRGDDTYFVEANDTLVEFFDEGYDTVFTTRNSYTLRANFERLVYVGSDAFRGEGNAGNNVISGGAGADVLIGLGGDDVLDGGDGVDTADYSAAWDWITVDLSTGVADDDGYGGMDWLSGIENIVGSAWDDEIYGDAGANVFTGGDGDDLLAGGGGVDVLRGGVGWDIADYSRAAGGVVVKLAAGAATDDGDGASDVLVGIEDVNGSDFDDMLFGDAGSNILDGGLGRDILIGGAGDDILIGGDGVANQLQGGLGDDLYVISANDTAVELAGEGHDAVETTLNRYTLRANFEDLAFFGVGNFVGTGNDLDNLIVGGDGDDILTGGRGDDFLVGTLSCGCGGGGNDTVVLAGVMADYLIEDLGGGAWSVTDSVAGRDGADLLIDIDQIRFADGFVLVLEAETAPLLSAKAFDQPLVLPGLEDKVPDIAALLAGIDGHEAGHGALTVDLHGLTGHTDGWLFG